MKQFSKSLLFWTLGAIVALLVVVVGGVWWQRERTMPQVQTVLPSPSQAQPEPMPAPAVQPSDPSATWKTYRDEKYGFEVKYPPNWIFLSKGVEALELWSPENYKSRGKLEGIDTFADLFVEVVPNLQDLPFPEWYIKENQEPFSGEELLPLLKNMKEVNVHGTKAYDIERPDYLESIYFQSPKAFIVFSARCLYRDCYPPEDSENERHILESLRLN